MFNFSWTALARLPANRAADAAADADAELPRAAQPGLSLVSLYGGAAGADRHRRGD